MLDFSTICPLEQAKVPDIKGLKQMRRMRRHKERNNLVCLAIFLKLERVVTFVAVEDQKTIAANRSRLGVPVKVLQPLQTQLIIGPAIGRRCNGPIVREVAVSVLVSEVILARTYDKRRDRSAFRIDGLNDGNPFPVPRLN